MPRHLRLRTSAFGLSVSLLALAIFPVTVDAANPPIRFELQYGQNCIGGSATPGHVNVKWRSSDGAAKAIGSLDETGHWSLCADAVETQLKAGDTIDANDGSYSRHYVVPNFSITVDRVSQTFYGTGPANRTVAVDYQPAPLADYGVRHQFRVASDGTWTFDPGHVFGGMFVELTWSSPNNDYLYAYSISPTLTLDLGKAGFSGQTNGWEHLSLALRDGTTNAKLAAATSTSTMYGYFSGAFRDSAGHAFKVAPGQRFKSLSLAANADFIVPNIEGTADKTTERVTGRCYDAGTSAGIFGLTIRRTGHTVGVLSYGSVDDADGNFSVRMTGHGYPGYDPANIKSGDRITISCLQSTDDWVQSTFIVP